MKNCYIYTHYTFGIGHIQRASLIAQALSKKFKVFLFYSGIEFDKKFNKNHKTVRLPGEIKKSRYSKSTLFENKNKEKVIENRINTIINEFKKNKPDVFITEFFPFAYLRLNKTLIPILKHIQLNYPKCKIICSARDFPISDRENILKYNKYKLKNAIQKYYDLILIHAPKKISMFKPLNPIFENLKGAPLKFTGYVVGKHKPKVTNPTKNKVLITVGGGRDGKEIIMKTLKALSLSNLRDKLKIHVVTGPFSNYSFNISDDFKEFKVKKYIPDLSSKLYNYDLVVSMAGYNTIAEILFSNTQSVVFPRPNSYEQQNRAIRVSKIFNCVDVVNKKISLEKLKKLLEKKLSIKKRKANNIDYFSGIEKSVKEVSNLLENE